MFCAEVLLFTTSSSTVKLSVIVPRCRPFCLCRFARDQRLRSCIVNSCGATQRGCWRGAWDKTPCTIAILIGFSYRLVKERVYVGQEWKAIVRECLFQFPNRWCLAVALRLLCPRQLFNNSLHNNWCSWNLSLEDVSLYLAFAMVEHALAGLSGRCTVR